MLRTDALRCEPAPLVVGKAKAPFPELLPKNAVLLDQVGDYLRLVAVDPAGERGEQQLKREEVRHLG